MEFLAKVVDSMPEQNQKTFSRLCRAHQRTQGKVGQKLTAKGSGVKRVYKFETTAIVAMRKDSNIAKGLVIFRRSYAAQESRMTTAAASEKSSTKGKASGTNTPPESNTEE